MIEAVIIEVSILTFVTGFILGTVIKGVIDRKFDREVQKSLIRVGQMADDEIEEKDKEIERLKGVISNLQLERAVHGLINFKEIDA